MIGATRIWVVLSIVAGVNECGYPVLANDAFPESIYLVPFPPHQRTHTVCVLEWKPAQTRHRSRDTSGDRVPNPEQDNIEKSCHKKAMRYTQQFFSLAH